MYVQELGLLMGCLISMVSFYCKHCSWLSYWQVHHNGFPDIRGSGLLSKCPVHRMRGSASVIQHRRGDFDSEHAHCFFYSLIDHFITNKVPKGGKPLQLPLPYFPHPVNKDNK